MFTKNLFDSKAEIKFNQVFLILMNNVFLEKIMLILFLCELGKYLYLSCLIYFHS